MKRKKFIFGLLFMAAILLSGCNMRTIDQMYCLPERPKDYMNHQSALEKAMSDLAYHAPIAGENRQPVQWQDLDGDGKDECIVFAKGGGENPLKILVFRQVGEAFVLADTLEGSGTAFEQVQYIHFTDHDGVDLVVTRQISDLGIRPLVVYSMENGKMVQSGAMNYMRFMTTDLNKDGLNELMVLQRGENAAANGSLSLLHCRNGIVESSAVKMSIPADNIQRIQLNRLNDGTDAVYLTGSVDGTSLITDVVALKDGAFSNITLSETSGFSEMTMCNYPIYGTDLDGDGTLELPEILPGAEGLADQHMIRWYSLNSDGTKVIKQYSYHNFAGGWYLSISEEIVHTLQVAPFGNSVDFMLTTETEEGEELVKLMTVYVFTGQEREELAVAENRFVLQRNESTVYAGHLEVASAALGMSRESFINAFHLIPQVPVA